MLRRASYRNTELVAGEETVYCRTPESTYALFTREESRVEIIDSEYHSERRGVFRRTIYNGQITAAHWNIFGDKAGAWDPGSAYVSHRRYTRAGSCYHTGTTYHNGISFREWAVLALGSITIEDT